MICFIAWIVFAVLGVFSARYRSYFLEATDCLFRRVTLRKCTTSFDQKMKLKVSTRLAAVNKPFGNFVFKNFEVVSWIFTVLMFVSLVWSLFVGGTAIYNWYAYGNCNGPDSTAACVINELTGATSVNGSYAPIVDINALVTDINIACPPSGVR